MTIPSDGSSLTSMGCWQSSQQALGETAITMGVVYDMKNKGNIPL